MREIKFRVWDLSQKTMRYTQPDWSGKRHWCTLVEPSNIALKFNVFLENYAYKNKIGDNNFILMQYTGLKDKNGEDIYEGDIVSLRNQDIGQVTYQTKQMRFVVEGKTNFFSFFLTANICRSEIIGNIYENSELLGKFCSLKR